MTTVKTEKVVSLFDRVSKLVGNLSNDGIVTFVDGNDQTRNVKLESLCDKFEAEPDVTIESLNLTAREALKRAIEYLTTLKTPQEFGYMLSGYAGFNIQTVVKVEGYSLKPNGEGFNDTAKDLIVGLKVTDGRGRKSTEKVITEI